MVAQLREGGQEAIPSPLKFENAGRPLPSDLLLEVVGAVRRPRSATALEAALTILRRNALDARAIDALRAIATERGVPNLWVAALRLVARSGPLTEPEISRLASVVAQDLAATIVLDATETLLGLGWRGPGLDRVRQLAEAASDPLARLRAARLVFQVSGALPASVLAAIVPLLDHTDRLVTDRAVGLVCQDPAGVGDDVLAALLNGMASNHWSEQATLKTIEHLRPHIGAEWVRDGLLAVLGQSSTGTAAVHILASAAADTPGFREGLLATTATILRDEGSQAKKPDAFSLLWRVVEGAGVRS